MRAPSGDGHPVLTLPGFCRRLSMAPMSDIWAASATTATRGGRAATPAGFRGCEALGDRLPEESMPRPAARCRSSDGAWAASMRAIWRCGRRRWCATSSRWEARLPTTSARPTPRKLYEALSGETVDGDPEMLKAIAGDLPVPTSSIYSRTDGIVNWRTCLRSPLRYRREYRGAPGQPCRARRQPGGTLGGGRPAGAGGGPIREI